MLNKQLIKQVQRGEILKRIQDNRRRKEVILQVTLKNDPDVDIILAELQNKMVDELAKHDEPLYSLLFGNNKVEHEGK